MTRSIFFRGGCIAAAFFMAATIFLKADTGAGVPLPPPLDKVAHFLYYGVMAGLLAHGFSRRWLWLPVILVPAIGLADEINQIGMPGREASLGDWTADMLGAAVFVAGYWWAKVRKA
jgi:VanZ family protein